MDSLQDDLQSPSGMSSWSTFLDFFLSFDITHALYFLLFASALFAWSVYRVVSYFASIGPDSDPFPCAEDLATFLNRQARRQRRFQGWSKFPWVFLWPSRNYVLTWPEDAGEAETARARDQVEALRVMITTSNPVMMLVRGYAFLLRYLWEDVADGVGDWLEFRRRLEALRTVDAGNEGGESKDSEKSARDLEKANWLQFLSSRTDLDLELPEDFESCPDLRTDVDKLVQLSELVDHEDDNEDGPKRQKAAAATESSSSSGLHPSSSSSSSTSTSTSTSTASASTSTTSLNSSSVASTPEKVTDKVTLTDKVTVAPKEPLTESGSEGDCWGD